MKFRKMMHKRIFVSADPEHGKSLPVYEVIIFIASLTVGTRKLLLHIHSTIICTNRMWLAIKVLLYIWCYVFNSTDTSATQFSDHVLDLTPVYQRLLKRMTEIERELNLHLNYNFTSAAPKESLLASNAPNQSGKIVKDEASPRTTVPPKKDNHCVSTHDSNGKRPKDTCKESKQTLNRIRKERSTTNLPVLNQSNTGGTQRPRQPSKTKRGNGANNKKNDHAPPATSPCSLDPRCGCCKNKRRVPEKGPGVPLHPFPPIYHLDREVIQQEIDNLVNRGCKVYHFRDSLFYNCEN